MNDRTLRRELVIGCAALPETMATWWRRETALYVRHGEEKYINGNGRDKPTPHAMIRVLNVMIARDFAVNKTGTDFRHKPDEVDDYGFRPYFIEDLMRRTKIGCEDTIRRALGHWAAAGVISLRRPVQDRTNKGRFSHAMFRLNPGVLYDIARRVVSLFGHLKNRVEKAIESRRSRKARARIDSAFLCSSSPPASAPLIAVADSSKERNIASLVAETESLFSEGQNLPAKRDNRNLEKILGILATQYPDVKTLTVEQRNQVRRLTNNILPRLRLTVETAKTLSHCKQWDDEHVAVPLGKTQGLLEGFHRFDNFMELVPYWETHVARLVKNFSLMKFDQAVDGADGFCRSVDRILFSAPMREVCCYTHTYPEVTTLRFLIEGMAKRWGSALVAAFANRCRKFIITRPYIYAIAVEKCPGIKQACGVSDYDHRRLLREYQVDQDKIAIWKATSWRHGFEQ